MTNLHGVLKSKDISLLTKFPIVKPMVFSVLLRSFNGLEPGGPELTNKKVKQKERG